MKTTGVETSLSMADFTRYFEAKKLGRLYFPNGVAYVHPGGMFFQSALITSFYISLTDLYKMVCGWKINHTLVPIEDIVAIIAFGSAVRYPGVQDVPYKTRKYWLFGKKIEKVSREPIQPADADFLVITGENMIREDTLEPISLETYDCGTYIQKGGIHIVNRGVNQVLNGIEAKDTVSASALREGVPIFFNGRFSELSSQTKIAATPRKIIWDEDDEGFLTGTIE